MIIRFKNWEKYNPKSSKTNSWVRLNVNLPLHQVWDELDGDGLKIFIYLLCQANQNEKSGIVHVSTMQVSRRCTVSEKQVIQAIEILKRFQVVETRAPSGLYKCSEPTPSTNERTNDYERTNEISKAKNPQAVEPYRANPVALWITAYKAKYGTRYEIQARDGKMLGGFGKTRTEEQVRVLFACYLAIDERLYSDSKHPLSLFFRDLQKISVAAATGVDPSKPKPFDYSKLGD